MRLVLYQPDIAGNVGTIMRLCACFGVPLDIIMPCGFPLADRQLKRSAMDYGAAANVTRHVSSDDFFTTTTARGRIVLLTSHGETSLAETGFRTNDTILLGSESAGVPNEVHNRVDLRVRIPMQTGFRSLNIAVAAGIALHEALRQTGMMPQ